uniref:Uncharacterized protein LOC114336860 n=1 Tax=Diabrotica virgifera virgifera TaxID=50390 RepID=A0A6P7GGK2_DIAVI
MLFCSENQREHLSTNIVPCIDNNTIIFQASAKNLGLTMDTKLNFNNHINLCLKKAYSMLKALYPHRHFLNIKTKAMLCESLILSHFNHYDHIYGPFLSVVNKKRGTKSTKFLS